MPNINVNGAALYYEEHGGGAEAIVFAHGLLWSGRIFRDQVSALQDRYRCITVDFRGQGQSEVTRDGYDMDTLAEDIAQLIEKLGCAPCHFVGHSMGGFIGLRLAIRRPALIKSLTLLECSADPQPAGSIAQYRVLSLVARWFGIGPVAGQLMPILFGKKFLSDPERKTLREECRQYLAANDRVGITRAVKGVIYRRGVYDQLHQITAPTLVTVGEQDVAAPLAMAERLSEGISGSQLVVIPGAGHTPTVEEPGAVTGALQAFLKDL
jgi:3-oxoadipate enol-lactonase